MNCERARKLLPFLHDGSLAPDVAREAGEHVERCEACREEYARISRTVQLVRMVYDADKPSVVSAAYRDAVMRNIRKRGRERTIVSWAVPAAASIFLVASITSYTFLHPGRAIDHFASTPRATVTRQTEASAEETALTAMYHYADVSVYDVLSQLGDDVFESGMDFNEIGE